MQEEPIFNVKKLDGEYVVWISHLGVLARSTDLEVAMRETEAASERVIDSFEKAGVPAPVQSAGSDTSSPISPLILANMISFALKFALVSVVVVVLLLFASRLLPLRGLSDFADYSRFASEERISKMIENATDIGKISRPILSELGIGCSCASDK